MLIDETRTATNMTRSHSRRRQGALLRMGYVYDHRKATPIAGLRMTGMIAPMVLDWPVNGFYNAEVIHRRGPWRSFKAVEFATLEWLNLFNHRRLLEPIGNIPSTEAKDRHYGLPDEQPVAA